MKRVAALACLAFLAAAPPALAQAPERIVADLSHSRVAITTDFVGSEILVYGAIARAAPAPADPLAIIVTVEGPPRPISVLRKARRLGLWVNGPGLTFEDVPSFYAVTSSGLLAETLTPDEDARYAISLDARLNRTQSPASDARAVYQRALAHLQLKAGAFTLGEGGVRLAEDTLFRADIALPAQVIEGDYKVQIFLLRDGRVMDQITRQIAVRKAGLERFFANLAHDNPLLYGILALFLATGAGWVGAAASARWRR
jgi:uncharacterized protein (TIGR02186 family)